MCKCGYSIHFHTGGLQNPFTKWDAPPKLNQWHNQSLRSLRTRGPLSILASHWLSSSAPEKPPWGGTLNVYWSIWAMSQVIGYGLGPRQFLTSLKLEGYGTSRWPIPKWPILRCIAGQNRKWSRELGKNWWERTCGCSCAALEVVHWNWPQKLRYPAIIVHLAPYSIPWNCVCSKKGSNWRIEQ